MSSKRVYISTTSFAQYDKTPLDLLEQSGLQVTRNPYGRTLTESEITAIISDFDFLLAGTEPITKNVLAVAKKLKVISRCGVGTDNVDLKVTEKLGITVLNTPDAPTQAVAELTVGLMIDLLRMIPFLDRKTRGGHWSKKMGWLLKGKHVGIIGFGRIGQKVAQLLEPFEVKIMYNDVVDIRNKGQYRHLDLDALLSWADIVSVHASSFSPEPILGRHQLERMKSGSFLINVARGDMIDSGALQERLRTGLLAGAALDVFWKEPYDGPLSNFDNVILTPHVGSYAREARVQMEYEAVQNLLSAAREPFSSGARVSNKSSELVRD